MGNDHGIPKHLFRRWRGWRKTVSIEGTSVSLIAWFMGRAEIWVGIGWGWGGWGTLGYHSFWDKDAKCRCCAGNIFSISLKFTPQVSGVHHSYRDFHSWGAQLSGVASRLIIAELLSQSLAISGLLEIFSSDPSHGQGIALGSLLASSLHTRSSRV